ncbi:DUF202 domain-containing protein [Spongiactinospora sp. 9N601]|uniref:DUF202 domain-containing protein n=1 Tax=Spongiactinospora sp. 9N601 TaxID=3375149 RepID=UPI0037A00270
MTFTGPGTEEDDATAQIRDPGLATERTDLAWMRTTVSLIALSAAIAKTAPAAGLVALSVGAGTCIVVRAIAQRARATAPRQRGRRLHVITVTLTLISLTTLAITLLSARSATRPSPLPKGPATPHPSMPSTTPATVSSLEVSGISSPRTRTSARCRAL